MDPQVILTTLSNLDVSWCMQEWHLVSWELISLCIESWFSLYIWPSFFCSFYIRSVLQVSFALTTVVRFMIPGLLGSGLNWTDRFRMKLTSGAP